MQDSPIIDFDFTLSQLSGNKELALKMLAHFEQEYAGAIESIQAFIDAEDFTAAKQLVHTLKGVTGNLGVNALHHASKTLEDSLKSQQDVDGQFESFGQTLKLTLKEIQHLSTADNDKPKENEKVSYTDTESHNELVMLLQRNEFIPADKLGDLLAGIAMAEQDKQALAKAIDDLDYPQALQLLGVS